MDLNFYPEKLKQRKGFSHQKILLTGMSVFCLLCVASTANAASSHRKAALSTVTTNSSMSKRDVVLKGKIVDEKGETLVGVSIRLKGTTLVASTDANGAFSITIPSTVSNPVLVVSYIGYTTQEVPVEGKTTISIQLKSSTNDLEEVVVVGYNTVKKSDLTGAVVSVGAKEIRSRPVTNALQAMQGKAAGVDITSNERPGQVGDIKIRGLRSLKASNSPLFVVDGIPLQAGGIDAINPNDIENIDILKDASATAIYGSRGANGVVLVTTKKGKTGRLTMDYVGTATIETLNDRMEMMNSAQYIEFRRDAFRALPASDTRKYPTVATLAKDREIDRKSVV